MHSRIYKGWVRHRRRAPTQHRFRYRLFMMYLDLAELPGLFDRVPFWSARRAAPAWFKRSDYYGPPDVPLDAAVRDLVEQRLGRRPAGPIRLLTHLRYFGYCMNPVSFYYCFDAAGTALEAIVAEITNTPWKQRHQYVLPVRNSGTADARRLHRFEFDKSFHVSPFMPMQMQYQWCFNEPQGHLVVHMENFIEGEQQFDATLNLEAAPLNAWALLGVLAAYPFMTLQVIAAIHWQALKLWWKKTPVHTHPALLPAAAPPTV